MQEHKEKKRIFRHIKMNNTLLFWKNNGRERKVNLLKKRRFGELKLGFFSDAGFKNSGLD
jgi:hypothetical protein